MIIKEIAQAIPVERKLIKYPTTSDLRAQRKAPQICYPMGNKTGVALSGRNETWRRKHFSDDKPRHARVPFHTSSYYTKSVSV